MSLEECYNDFGGNYNEVVKRLYNDKLVEKFLLKFIDDKSYSDLKNGLSNKDLEAAFRAAHTLKGVCQNLGIDALFESSHAITEMLRPGSGDSDSDELQKMMSTVDADYKKTINAISKYKSEM